MVNWVKILALLDKNYSYKQTDLNYSSHLTLLIAIILSARTKDEYVNKFCSELINLPEEELLSLTIEEIREKTKNINLYIKKSEAILNLLILFSKNKDAIYKKEEIIKIKGIGEKTANVFLNIVTNEALVGVDVHVKRIAERVSGIKFSNEKKVEEYFKKNLKREELKNLNAILVHHGRKTCKSNPLCNNCFIRENCSWFNSK